MKAYARTTDPQTSHDAAASMEGVVELQATRILGALRKHGPMAAEEVANCIGMEMVQVARLWAPLKRAGKIEVYEAGGHRNRSGRMADIMIAVEQAEK